MGLTEKVKDLARAGLADILSALPGELQPKGAEGFEVSPRPLKGDPSKATPQGRAACLAGGLFLTPAPLFLPLFLDPGRGAGVLGCSDVGRRSCA